MSNPKTNYMLDIALAALLAVSFVTGVLKWPGLLQWLGLSPRGMGNLSLIHDWAGLLMGLAIFVHLALHWRWLMSMTKALFKGKK